MITNSKLLNLLLIITSLFGYLEWGQGNSSFLFQVEGKLLQDLVSDPKSVLHPFTILPLLGQLLLLATLFQKKPSKIPTLIGIGLLSLLLGLMFFIGILQMHLKILLSTLPFMLITILTIRNNRRS